MSSSKISLTDLSRCSMSRDSSHWSSAAGRRVERVGPIDPDPLRRPIRALALVLAFAFAFGFVLVRPILAGRLVVLVLMVVIGVAVLVRVLHAVGVLVRVLVVLSHAT